MMDNIKINKPLSSLASIKKVKPAGHRQNNNQQNLLKETFKDKQKKKKTKEDPMNVEISDGDVTAGRAHHTRHAVASENSNESLHKRIIDIRV
jgi:hypothetical protein